MLSKTIFVAASFFLAVTAVPTPADVEVEARNAPPPPPPACGSTLKAQCCDSVTKTLIGLLNIPVGVGCVDGKPYQSMLSVTILTWNSYRNWCL